MIEKSSFGQLPDGQEVDQYRLRNNNDTEIAIITYGAALQKFEVFSEKLGKSIDIVTGFDTLEGYIRDPSYKGAVVGRYANRIGDGKFHLDGEQHTVVANLAGNCLHGGSDGFSHRIWQVTMLSDSDEPSLQLCLTSPDGDQGFPGRLQMSVTYTLTHDNCLRIEYAATTSASTVFNPTHHAYFNLCGHASGDTFDQEIMVNADIYTPADETGIPTGELAHVDDSAFDLRQWVRIGDVLTNHKQALSVTSGLDHNFCLNKAAPRVFAEVGGARSAVSGLSMTVKSDMPGMQVYTGNFMSDDIPGKDGVRYAPHHAFCLETQFYPDSPNKPDFPSSTLLPGERFQSCTEYWIAQE